MEREYHSPSSELASSHTTSPCPAARRAINSGAARPVRHLADAAPLEGTLVLVGGAADEADRALLCEAMRLKTGGTASAVYALNKHDLGE